MRSAFAVDTQDASGAGTPRRGAGKGIESMSGTGGGSTRSPKRSESCFAVTRRSLSLGSSEM